MERDPFAAVEDGARHAELARLGAEAPLHRLMLPTGIPAWVVTGYREAKELLNDSRLVKGGPSHAPFARELPAQNAALNTHMAASDPPDHTRLRKLASAAFSRRRIDNMAPIIEKICNELLDDLAARFERGPVDLIEHFAYPLPIAVISQLLGIPDQKREGFKDTCGALVQGSITSLDAYAHAADAMLEFVRDLIAQKRREPDDDLLSALIEARDGEQRLSEDELTSMLHLLVLAGHETTGNLIANGVRALLCSPDQLALLQAEPDRMSDAVEEVLRYDGSAQVPVPSFASEEMTIAGETIAKGDFVVVSLLGANRDPQKFPEPDVFDISRGAGHLGFGHGMHFCLGAPLARLEGRIAIGALVARFPDLELAVPAASLRRVPALLVNKLSGLPVRLRPTR
ncbi:cytochrome P450 [Streptomyces sp. Lzd4kr]|nr:cytochrome P450 [Streptomyces sp. Lzd4kr]